MQADEKLNKVLARTEPVEWHYDGLNGRVIKWTKENGSHHDDPSVLAWLVGRDGTLVAACPGGKAYAASSLAKWLDEALRKYEKEHPRTAVPLVFAEVDGMGECPALDPEKPALLYFGRESGDKKQLKACRKFEKGALGSKKAARESTGWVLLRFDLAREDHAAFARKLGIQAAPALRIIPPGRDPIDPGTKLRGANLAYYLKKFSAPEES
ncbi:MAG: hypothetical protein ACYTHK_10950 [Planctomycetota bacterium]